MKKGKKYQAVAKLIDKTKQYSVDEAFELVEKTVTTKFESTVELHVNLGIDTKKGEQQVRGTIVPPHASGKMKRIAVFAQGKAADDAKKAGAALVGGADLIEEIRKTGKVDFELAIATPDMMKELAKVAKVLGPKGLMPNPKSETVTADIAKTMAELAKGKIAFKNDKNGNLHIALGKMGLGKDKLKENFKAVIDEIKKSKPEEIKGTYLKTVTLTTSMGPGIRIKV
jgi:large subunit ribosomal protein L1